MKYFVQKLCIVGVFLLLVFVVRQSAAQDDTSLVSDLGDSNSLATGTQGTQVGGNDLHSDVSDPTHSQLLGSSLSPADFSYSSSYSGGVTSSSVTSESQSLVGTNDLPSYRSRNPSFFPGGAPTATMSSGQDAVRSLGTVSMVGAFAGSTSRLAFTNPGARLSDSSQSFSGQSMADASQVSPSATGGTPSLSQRGGIPQSPGQSPGQTSTAEPSLVFVPTDPVLTGAAESFTASLQLGTDLPRPSVAAIDYFLDPGPTAISQYEYEDGQTPPIASSLAPRVGTILGVTPDYLASASGFPDSTKGEAALPTEASNSISSVVPLRDITASPFPAVSEGKVYGVKTGLNPTIHIPQAQVVRGSFRAAEKRAQEERIIHGMSISESSAIYQADLRDYQRNGIHGRRQSSVHATDNSNQIPVFQTTFHHQIR